MKKSQVFFLMVAVYSAPHISQEMAVAFAVITLIAALYFASRDD